MQRPLAVLLVAALFLGACSDSADNPASGPTSAVDASSEPAKAGPEETISEEEAADKATTAPQAETTIDEAKQSNQPDQTEGPTDSDQDDTTRLCDAYLTYLGSGGVGDLAEALGPDAPPGALEAIEFVQSTDVDFLDLLNALDNLRGYVSPICRDRWDTALLPAESDRDAVNTFFAALVAGDRPMADTVAPADVLANFEPWAPIEPDSDVGPASFDYSGGGDFSMLLGPTLTVFCTVEGGVVTSCLFGE